MRPIALCLFVLACAGGVQAQTPPCGAEYHLFDFWIGDWEVYAGDTKVGDNTIQPILDGCVLQEMWTGAKGTKGTSLNYYNPATKQYHQFWVYRDGTPLPLMSGTYHADGRKMVLSGLGTQPDGTQLMHRITWTHNRDDTVRQYWENSTDGGTTWTVAFDGLYKKKGG